MFHSRGWLDTLRRTYAYEPIAYTTSPPGVDLADGLVFCRIASWLTGRRLVSLPFSDHVEPLIDGAEALRSLLATVTRDARGESWRYIEIRPLSNLDEHPTGFVKSNAFYSHRLDLRPPLETLLRSFHKSNVQAKIRRAEREALTYEAGRSEALLRTFYRLLLLTCRRRRLPPQPLAWFHHLIDCVGEGVMIHVARKNGRPTASILTLTFKHTLVYKYGCSDASLNNLGGIQFLFWKAIQEAKRNGLHEFDLGRSAFDTPGLVTFKDRWGATRSVINYFRYPASATGRVSASWSTRLAKPVFAYLPDRLLIAAGEILYPHVG